MSEQKRSKRLADFIEKMPFTKKPIRSWADFTATQIITIITEELKKEIEIKRANAFSVSLFGSRDHQLGMDAMVSAYDVVLNIIKEVTNGDD